MIAIILVACASAPTPAEIAPPGVDTDGDRLDDREELALGTDPGDPDTDADGYRDGDEVVEGVDPLDPESRIYRGGWPYNPDKDELPDPGFGGVAAVGAPVPRFVGADAFGDPVDLYDFVGHGVPVVLDVSAGWCEPCRALAAWLGGAPSDTFDADPDWSSVRSALDAGDLYWVTLLFEDDGARPADAAFAAEWAALFPQPRVAVLVDPDEQLIGWLFPAAYPNLHQLDATRILTIYDPFGPEQVLDTW